MRRLHKEKGMTRQERQQFIDSVAPAAMATMKRTGVPASVTIAQAAIESADHLGNWGKSALALPPNNNYFGIKARQRAGAPIEPYCEFLSKEYSKQLKKMVEVKCDFRKFASVQDSFDRHADLLSKTDIYQPAMKAANDPLLFAAALGPRPGGCGYSTNPDYAILIGRLITEWDLGRFDKQAKEAA